MRKTIFAVVAVAVMVMAASAAFAEDPSSGYREDKNYKRDFWVRFGARNVQDLLDLKGAAFVPGSNNSMIKFEFTEENGYVKGDILDIEIQGTYDSPEGTDLPLPCKDKIFCPTVVTIKLTAADIPSGEEIVVTSENLETYCNLLPHYVEGSLWKVVSPKNEYLGNVLRIDDPTLSCIMWKSDGSITAGKTVVVTAATTAAEAARVAFTPATDVTLLAKKADVETSDISTYAAACTASPTVLAPEEVAPESNSVEFYVASEKWTPKTDGGDLIKIDVDERTTLSADGTTYTSTDGNYIGTVTLWYKSVEEEEPLNPYAPENDPAYKDSGSGGGGCDAGFGIMALAVLPLFCKKGRK